jgi:hypothetical protein
MAPVALNEHSTANQAETGNKLIHEAMATWDVIPCDLVDMYQSFTGICCLHLHSSMLIQEQNVRLFDLCSYKYEILHEVGVAYQNFAQPPYQNHWC